MISPDVVDVLLQEHERIRQLCADVRAARGARRAQLLGALQRTVHLHELGERAVAHPAARNSTPAGDEIALAFQTEGETLERALAELNADDPGFDDKFAVLAAALFTHAAREERDEFPLLRLYVPAQRLHMMASEMHDVRTMGRD